MNETMKLEVPVCDGKYTFCRKADDWRIYVLRYGEPWLTIETGANAIDALMFDLHEARDAHTTGLREGQVNLAQVRAALDGFLGFVRGGYGNALCEEYQATLHRLAAKGDEVIHAAGKPAPTYTTGLREGLRLAAARLEALIAGATNPTLRDFECLHAELLADAAPTEVTRG